MHYVQKKFNLSELKNISLKQVAEHLGLYSGYVKNINLVQEKIDSLTSEDVLIIDGLRKKLDFEFNGMRMHEYYFEQLEGGPKELNVESGLREFLIKEFGSFDDFVKNFKALGTTRGIGWAVVYYDKINESLKMIWVDGHNIGQMAGLPIILVMDMWEHAFMVDYVPSEKVKYIDAFFENLNWEIIEKRFKEIT